MRLTTQFVDFGLEFWRQFIGALEQTFLAVYVLCRNASSGRSRVCRVGIAVEQLDCIAGAGIDDRVVNLVIGGNSRHRNGRIVDCLSHGDHVGSDTKVFAGGCFAQASEASDHFVKNQQNAVFGANIAQALQISFWRNENARGPGNRFNNDRSDCRSIVQCDDALKFVGQMLAPCGLTFAVGGMLEIESVRKVVDIR